MLRLIDDERADRLQRAVEGRLAAKHIRQVRIGVAAVDAGRELAVSCGGDRTTGGDAFCASALLGGGGIFAPSRSRRHSRRRRALQQGRQRRSRRLGSTATALRPVLARARSRARRQCRQSGRGFARRADRAMLGPRQLQFDAIDRGLQRCFLGRRSPPPAAAAAACAAGSPASAGHGRRCRDAICIARPGRSPPQQQGIIIDHRA